MKITGLYIDGFGIFHDQQFAPFSEKLTILKGSNETGKTTILQFIRRMLYGFPDGRSKENLYTPVAGKIGGRLEFIDDRDTTYTLQRLGKKGRPELYLHDGTSAGGAAELQKLLGKADAEFYNTIYAIGLSELAAFETLQKEGIKDRLFSAGTGSLKVPVSIVRNELQKNLSEIYKKSGSKQILSMKNADLGRIESSIRTIEQDQDEYDRLNEQLLENQIRIDSYDKHLKKVNTSIHWYERLLDVWDDFNTLNQAKESLADLPEISSFPKGGITPLENSIELIAELEEEIATETQKCTSQHEQLKAIVVNELVLEKQPEIRVLEQGVGKFRSDRTAISERRQKKEHTETELRKLISDLGSGWDEIKIQTVDLSIPSKTFVEQVGQDLDTLREDLKDKDRDIRTAEKEITTHRKAIAAFNENIERQGHPATSSDIKNQLSDLQKLRSTLPRYQEAETKVADLTLQEAQNQDILNGIAGWENPPRWPAYLMIFFGIIIIGAGRYLNEMIGAVVACVVLLVAAGVYLASVKMAATRRETDLAQNPSLQVSQEDIASLKTMKESAIRGRDDLKQTVMTFCSSCEFETQPDIEMMTLRDVELRDEQQRAVLLANLHAELEAETTALEGAEMKLAKHLSEQEVMVSSQNARLQEWNEWLSSMGFDATLMPKDIPAIFSVLQQCTDTQRALTGIVNELDALQDAVQKYTDAVSEIAAYCNVAPEEQVDVLAEKLSSHLSEHTKLRDEKSRLIQGIAESNVMIEGLKQKCLKEQGKLTKLLKDGMASTPDEFRENAKFFEDREVLLQTIATSKSSIFTIAGKGGYVRVISTLEASSPADIEAQIEAKNTENFDLKDTRDKLKEENGGIRKNLEDIEKNGDLSYLHMKRCEILEDIRQYSRNWASLTAAETILNMAIEKYERERQPLIIKEAQSFLGEITDGRYTRILTPIESQIRLEEASGAIKEIENLSTGTAEQLYLSLRFGYIRDFGRNGTALPVIFDDILVNFDPVRQQKACEAIRSLSETNQVFYFTCHPETARMLEEAVPESKVIEIE